MQGHAYRTERLCQDMVTVLTDMSEFWLQD